MYVPTVFALNLAHDVRDKFSTKYSDNLVNCKQHHSCLA